MIGHNAISLFHITVSVTEIPQVWEKCEYDQMELQRKHTEYMMTLPNGIGFCVTGPLWGDPPTTNGFPSQRASNAGFDVLFDVSLKMTK